MSLGSSISVGNAATTSARPEHRDSSAGSRGPTPCRPFSYCATGLQNPEVLNATAVDLVGGFRLFVPEQGSPFYLNAKPINLGHVRNPTETYTPTEKSIDTAVYGASQTVLKVTTKIEETGAFETASVRDLRLRGLWAGSAVYADSGALGAEVWVANTPYALDDLVLPTVPNGHYYKVTTTGTSSSAEPTSWKTDGTTNSSGGVTFTDQGVIPEGSSLIVIQSPATTPPSAAC